MKKLFTSKPFIISALCLLSVGILATCWIVSNDDYTIFTPEPPQESTPVDAWVEKPSGPEATALNPGANTEDKDTYPKIVEDNGQEVVIDFTPTQSSAPEPPEAPTGKTETADEPGSAHPVNPDPKVTAPEPSKPSGPTPGSTNENGEFYDPVFGWVKPGKVNQQDIDSEGDPNKMVGNMGD